MSKKESHQITPSGIPKKLRLKICGMKYPENIQQVTSVGPDYLGFIFFEGSPRHFRGTIPEISSEIKKTGVFVDARKDYILQKAAEHNLQAVQLHGKESPDLCKHLKDGSLEVIKVFSVKDQFDQRLLEPYEGKVDFFLFDTKGKAKGGNGIIFDWEILKSYSSETPFFLSGGLGLEELEKAQEFHFPDAFFGIDINSRFEEEPGLKNLDLLKKIKLR